MRYMGLEIYIDSNMTERVQYSRSPSRAKRRAKKGHPQHFADRPQTKILKAFGKLFMHPATFEQVKKELENDQNNPVVASASGSPAGESRSTDVDRGTLSGSWSPRCPLPSGWF